MSLIKTKVWPPFQIAVLKTVCLIFGLIVGAYYADVIKDYLWILAGIGVVCWIEVFYFYYLKKD